MLDDGWRFQLGDPPDVTTNVTYYPEIPDLAKLDADEVGSATNTNSESYMETSRIDPIATHAGENVSFVQTNYNDSAWRLLNLPHDWVVDIAVQFQRGWRTWLQIRNLRIHQCEHHCLVSAHVHPARKLCRTGDVAGI